MLDYAGRRTYDTCYRVEYIWGVEEAVLVTQWFHLDRALYTCDKPGIDAVGVAADRHDYYSARYWLVREVAAASRAWLDLNALRPTGVGGQGTDSVGRFWQNVFAKAMYSAYNVYRQTICAHATISF